MNARPAIYALAARYRLDGHATRRLLELAVCGAQPEDLAVWVWRALAMFASGLVGLGAILWVAANWDSLGRFGQLALLQGLIAAAGAGAVTLVAARAALSLLALLATGALLAYLGQIYPAGADPWQLFAWWAALSLPLALAVRSDVLWTPWAMVAMAAVALWAQSYGSRPWASGPSDTTAYLLSWSAAGLLVAALSPALSRLTGAGIWALRTAATLAIASVVFPALFALFARPTGTDLYWLGLLALGAAVGIASLPALFEVGILSAATLGLDTLLVAGLARLLLDDLGGREPIVQFFVLGIAAAGLVAASVSAILWLVRSRASARGGASI